MNIGTTVIGQSNREEEKKMNKHGHSCSKPSASFQRGESDPSPRAIFELVQQGFARFASISDKARPIGDAANLYGYFIVTDSGGNVRRRWL